MEPKQVSVKPTRDICSSATSEDATDLALSPGEVSNFWKLSQKALMNISGHVSSTSRCRMPLSCTADVDKPCCLLVGRDDNSAN